MKIVFHILFILVFLISDVFKCKLVLKKTVANEIWLCDSCTNMSNKRMPRMLDFAYWKEYYRYINKKHDQEKSKTKT